MYAVRYYSRTGNTKALAEAMAKAIDVEAVSVDEPDAELKEYVDVLFIGGALYKYGLDENLTEYLKGIDPDKVGKAVLFSTTWFSKHSLELMIKELTAKGIELDNGAFYVRGKPSKTQLRAAKEFAQEHIAVEDEEDEE